MIKKFFRKLVIIFSCLLFLTVFNVSAQTISAPETSQLSELKITSVSKGAFWDNTVYLKGKSSPNSTISLSIKDGANTFSYSIIGVSIGLNP